MALTQLVYASQPFGFDEAMLNGILITARACNTRDEHHWRADLPGGYLSAIARRS